MSKTYLRPCNVTKNGIISPLYRVDKSGCARQIGKVHQHLDGFYYEPLSSEQPKKYRSLPWFIQDMRPDGFAGRSFAHHMHQELGLPKKLEDWSDNHLLRALSLRGEDCIGALIVGEESLDRYAQSNNENASPIATGAKDSAYLQMATAAMEGKQAGSLAGGEQPKFTAVVERNCDIANVLVKFSPRMETPGGRRWADLLVCEHLALETIRGAGFPAARSTIVFAGGRSFLEVERFDRIGRFGRSPVNSLGVVDDEFFGHRDNWMNMADRLEKTRMVSSQDAEALRWLWAFGEMIANTDMHFGNASLIMTDFGKPTFSLAPAYDMLPMLYRPREGELTSPQFTPPLVASMSHWEGARQSALQFWEAATHDERISPEFREVCAHNRETLGSTMRGPRIVS